MLDQEIQFISNGIKLAGALTVPDSGGPFPGVLFLTGSGQVDRNENHKKMHMNAFYEISRHLARHGIASLRYDKRGIGQSEGDYWATGFHDRVKDAMSALRHLKQQENIQAEDVFLIGHSEGAFLSTRLAGDGADVAGIILLSGSVRKGEAVLKWQALQIAKGLRGINGFIIKMFHINVAKAQDKQINKIKQSKKDWFRQQLIVKVNAKWLREFLAYDPAEDLPRITVPILAITGSKDIQVDPGDLEQMKSIVKAPFEGHIIQNMTHVLRSEEGEPSISKYKEEIKKPVEPKVLDLIVKWLEPQINNRGKAVKMETSYGKRG